MLNEYLITLILDMLNVPAELSAGIFVLLQSGYMNLCLSVLNICLCMICVGLKKSFFEQSGMTLVREPVAVVAGGITAYGLGIALTLIFLVSVVGFPIAGLMLLVMVFFIFIGQTALSVMFGKIFADKFYRTLEFYPAVLVGAFFIETLNNLPYVHWLFRFVVWPVLALGVLYAGFTNGFVKKIYYPLAEGQHKAESHGLAPDRRRLREIVLRQPDDRV